jgi:hypothetical protein
VTEAIGTVTITREWDREQDRYATRINRADARAAISAQLLTLIKQGMGFAKYADGVLTLTDDYGQRFDYRLGEYDQQSDAYPMELAK